MTTATSEPNLYDRLVDLFGSHDIQPADRGVLRAALDTANSFEELPKELQDKILELETLPRQSWDDPSDVPDNLEDL